jgi:hypothetical protein
MQGHSVITVDLDGSALARGQGSLEVFRSFFARGEIWGNPCMWSQIAIHRAGCFVPEGAQ